MFACLLCFCYIFALFSVFFSFRPASLLTLSLIRSFSLCVCQVAGAAAAGSAEQHREVSREKKPTNNNAPARFLLHATPASSHRAAFFLLFFDHPCLTALSLSFSFSLALCVCVLLSCTWHRDSEQRRCTLNRPSALRAMWGRQAHRR